MSSRPTIRLVHGLELDDKMTCGATRRTAPRRPASALIRSCSGHGGAVRRTVTVLGLSAPRTGRADHAERHGGWSGSGSSQAPTAALTASMSTSDVRATSSVLLRGHAGVFTGAAREECCRSQRHRVRARCASPRPQQQSCRGGVTCRRAGRRPRHREDRPARLAAHGCAWGGGQAALRSLTRSSRRWCRRIPGGPGERDGEHQTRPSGR